MESFPYWKNIYKTLATKQEAVSEECISDVLKSTNDDLFKGILIYKPYTKDSYKNWKEKVAIKEKKSFEDFANDLAKAINLDCEITYTMFCNFIMFEYYGKIEDVSKAIQFKFSKESLVERIWSFMRAERMFHIKAVQYILRESTNNQHKFYHSYNSFVKKNDVKKIRHELKDQFLHLLDAINYTNNYFEKAWKNRNEIEAMEILITYIYTIDITPLDEDELFDILGLFTSQTLALFILSEKNKLDINTLQYALILVALKDFWKNEKWFHKFENFAESYVCHGPVIDSNPILSFCFCLLVTSIPSEKVQKDFPQYYPMLTETALNPDAFAQLYLVMESCILKGTKFEHLVRKAVYSILEEMFSRTASYTHICNKSFRIGETFALLMEDSEICDHICGSSSPANTILKAIVNMFPYNFYAFCAIIQVLMKKPKYSRNVVKMLYSLSVYTEENKQIEGDFNKTIGIYSPIPGLEIPVGSSVTLLNLSADLQLIQFEGDFSYTVLLYLNALMSEIPDYAVETSEQVKKLDEYLDMSIKGLDLMCSLMDWDSEMWNSSKHYQIVAYAMFILGNAKNGQYKRWELINIIMKFFCTAIRNQGAPSLHLFLRTMCLPVTPLNLMKLIDKFQMNLAADCPFLQVILNESCQGNYQMLNSYISFLDDALELQVESDRILIPGMMFIVVNVFPYHMDWKNCNLSATNTVTMNLLQLFLNTLQVCSKSDDPHLKFVYDYCLEAILSYDYFTKAFVGVIRFNNRSLENIMLNELNWKDGPAFNVTKAIRLSLSIVMFLFANVEYEKLQRTLFWMYFTFSPVNMPGILRIICEYMNHKFDPALPPLACILFRRMCMDSNLPVFASLELAEYQVQMMFLDRLRDPLEDDDMKILLIQLINTCVESQSGMTAAIFNLHKKQDCETEDTIISYIGDYLNIASGSPEYVGSPVQMIILRLFHTLWADNRTILIDDLIKEDNFWANIFKPLLRPRNGKNAETFYRILDILAIEATYAQLLPNLEVQLTKLLEPITLTNITTVITKAVKSIDENPCIIDVLRTWKKFWVYMLLNHKEMISAEAFQILVSRTLKAIIEQVREEKHLETVDHWMGIYLYMSSKCDPKYFNSMANFEELTQMFRELKHCFLRLSVSAKDAVMAIAINSLENFSDIFESTSDQVCDFLCVIESLMHIQYEFWTQLRHKEELLFSEHFVWMQMVTFANRMLEKKVHQTWVFYTQFLQKVLQTLMFYMSHTKTMPIAKICAQFLYNYACSPLYEDFKTVEFALLYDKVNTPTELLQFDIINKKHISQDKYIQLWLTYFYLFEMKTKLLERLGPVVLKNIFEFIYMQRRELNCFLKLTESTLHPVATRLIVSYLDLYIVIITKWRRRWILFDESSYVFFFKLLTVQFHRCLHILQTPRVMNFYSAFEGKLQKMTSMPLTYIGEILNGIMQIQAKICYAFYKTSPCLFDQLVEPRKSHDFPFMLNLIWDFHVPDHYNARESKERLTFGSVLSFMHFLCRTKHQQLREKPPKDTWLYMPYLIFEGIQREVPENMNHKYISVVENGFTDLGTADKINPQRRLQSTETYSWPVPWLTAIDPGILNTTFEVVGTLLASQVCRYVRPPLPSMCCIRELMLKRELCPELQFFNEFVHKKLTDSQRYYIDGHATVCIKKSTSKQYETSEYLLMISNWFLQVCDLTP